MAKPLTWKLLKANLYFILGLLLLVVTFSAAAQPQLTFSHSIPVSSATAISEDQNGNIYLLDTKQNLLRLDSLGKPLDTFSPPTRGRITSISAWNSMKVLLFYQDRQELLLLDRFLRPIGTTRLLDLDYLNTVRAATLASDEGFWLFNETNFSLDKLDLRLGKITSETPLNLILERERFDVRMVREYQNMIYLLDFNNGIYVFDNLGNYKNKLPFTGVSYINFRKNELYFVKQDKLVFHHLYTSQQREIAFPTDKKYTSALVSDRNIYLFSAKRLDVYTLE